MADTACHQKCTVVSNFSRFCLALMLSALGVGYSCQALPHSDDEKQVSSAPETRQKIDQDGHAKHSHEAAGELPKEHGRGHSHNQHSHWSAPPEAVARLNPIPARQRSIARGEAIYHYRCVACHGAGGQGDGPVAAALSATTRPTDLVAMVPHHTDGDLGWKIANGRGFMPQWKGVLSEEQIWDVINYLRALSRQPCC
jgi:mono/diheme cytochrome c family protein